MSWPITNMHRKSPTREAGWQTDVTVGGHGQGRGRRQQPWDGHMSMSLKPSGSLFPSHKSSLLTVIITMGVK